MRNEVENMKKVLMIAALALTATTANATDLSQWKIPANSVLNDSVNAVGAPLWLEHLANGIDVRNVLGAVVGTVIDPRGYPDSAYPGGKRPNLNVQLGNMKTGKCYSDPKGNGIWCP